MSTIHDPVVVETPKPSLRERLVTKKNAKRAAIAGGAVAALLYVKKRLNASGSASVDLHVETDDTNTNDN